MHRRFAIHSALFGLGFISISTQIYLLREFLFVFQGNELTIGIVLANWMLVTGLGAFIGRFSAQMKDRDSFLLFLMILLSVIPVLTLLKLDVWRSVVLPAGSMAGIREIFYSSLLIQTPVCFAGGFLFTALASALPKAHTGNNTGHAYAVESSGSLAGGALVNFILLWTLEPFTALIVNATVYLASVALYAAAGSNGAARIFVPLLALAVVAGLCSVPFSRISRLLLFEGQEVVMDRETPYGRVVVTGSDGQRNVYGNGTLLFSSGNVITNEESVHFAMSQHPGPERVLLVSGGLSGTIPEILKYHPVRIDYLESDPALMEMADTLEGAGGGVVRLLSMDARRYIERTGSFYDVALINLPGPSNLQLNRYYTDEFFGMLKRRMTPGGVVCLPLPTGSDYVSAEAAKLNSSILKTLKRHFREALVLPSGRNYFLASDSSLSVAVPELIAARGVVTAYVNPYYFDSRLLEARSRFVTERLSEDAGVNRDFHPVAYFYQQDFWLSHFRQNYTLIGGVIVLVLALTFLAINRVNAGIFAAGFAASSMEVALLLGFQIAFGYVYQALGVIIMVFMSGLALGAAVRPRLSREPSPRIYLLLQILLAVTVALVPAVLLPLPFRALPDGLVFTIFLLFSFAAAFLTGCIFSAGAWRMKGGTEKVTASAYAVDLYGSALGALLTGVILLPLLGIAMTMMMLALLITATAAWYLLTPGRR